MLASVNALQPTNRSVVMCTSFSLLCLATSPTVFATVHNVPPRALRSDGEISSNWATAERRCRLWVFTCPTVR